MKAPKEKRCTKASAMLAGAAGGAVCLLGGGTVEALSGKITSSNADNTFVKGDALHCFGNIVNWGVSTLGYVCFSNDGGNPLINADPAVGRTHYIETHVAGVEVNAGMAGGFLSLRQVFPNISDKYMAVSFQSGGTRYGWVHIVSTPANGLSVVVDKWGYDETGGNIFTLSKSVAVKALPLADGKKMLHWTNGNEAGIASYVVEVRSTGGQWETHTSESPGVGRYSLRAAGGATYRLRVEQVDGTSKIVDFVG